MKSLKILITTGIMALAALPALADDDVEAPLHKSAECTAPFPISLFEEKANGENCPANQAEKTVGDLLFLGTAFVVGGEVITGGKVFPLNGGILAGL